MLPRLAPRTCLALAPCAIIAPKPLVPEDWREKGWAIVESLALSWWMWLVMGLVLMVFELATPGGFFIVFFGVGAVIVGLLELVGLHMSLLLQGILFVVTSLVAITVFRRPLLERFNKKMPTGTVDAIVGETAHAIDEIPANGFGKVELRGAAWNAQNVGEQPIARGARCKVDRVDGLTFYVRA